jgi:hypothetical protein
MAIQARCPRDTPPAETVPHPSRRPVPLLRRVRRNWADRWRWTVECDARCNDRRGKVLLGSRVANLMSNRQARHTSVAHPDARCMFCGSFAFEIRLLKKSNDLMCEKCLEKAARLFSDRGQTPRRAHSERCVACRRNANGRLLVAGAGAAICRRCSLVTAGKAAWIKCDWPDSRPEGVRIGDLDDARTEQARAHIEYQRIEETIRSLRAPYPIVFRVKLAAQKAVAEFDMEPALKLVSLDKPAY